MLASSAHATDEKEKTACVQAFAIGKAQGDMSGRVNRWWKDTTGQRYRFKDQIQILREEPERQRTRT